MQFGLLIRINQLAAPQSSLHDSNNKIKFPTPESKYKKVLKASSNLFSVLTYEPEAAQKRIKEKTHILMSKICDEEGKLEDKHLAINLYQQEYRISPSFFDITFILCVGCLGFIAMSSVCSLLIVPFLGIGAFWAAGVLGFAIGNFIAARSLGLILFKAPSAVEKLADTARQYITP